MNAPDAEFLQHLIGDSVRGVAAGIVLADGTIAWCNAGLSEHLGYRPAEVIGKRFAKLLWPGEVAGIAAQMKLHFSGRADHLQFECALRSRANARRDVVITANRTAYCGKEASIGIVVDVTDQMRFRRRSETSDARFRSLIENAPDAIVIYNGETGLFIDANAAAEELFGRGRQDIVGFPPTHFYTAQQSDARPVAESVAEHDRRATAGECLSYERRVLRPDGEERICEVTIIRLPSEEGCILRTSFVDVTEARRHAHALLQANRQLSNSFVDLVAALGRTIERRDPYTAGHQQRVASLSVSIGREMGLSDDVIAGLHLAAVVHDVGKIAVPAEILCKPGEITPAERALVREHSQAGYEILKDVTFPWPIAEIVLQHHERLDGTGYPFGLKEPEILPESRIIAVADAVDAIMSHRPYRPGLGTEAACRELRVQRSIAYDAAVVDACLKILGARSGR